MIITFTLSLTNPSIYAKKSHDKYLFQVIKPDQFARSKRKISTSSNGANTLNGAIKGLKPVIVYLHGGLFMSGFTHVYRANYFLENDDVVLVTLDYRVNSFGTFST